MANFMTCVPRDVYLGIGVIIGERHQESEKYRYAKYGAFGKI